MATLFGLGRRTQDEAQRKLYQVGTAGAAVIPGPWGKAARSRVREEHGQFVENGPGGPGQIARAVRSGVTWASSPETNAQAVLTLAGLGFTAGVSKTAVAVGARRGDDIVAGAGALARLFGRGAAKQSDEAVTFASRGIDDVTARRGVNAVDSVTRRTPEAPLAGRRQQLLSPGARNFLAVGSAATAGGIILLPRLGQAVNQGSQQAGQTFPNIFNPLGEGLANLFAGVGAGAGLGAGAGVANTLGGVGQGLKSIAGPVLLLGGAAALALVLVNKSGGIPRRR